MKIDGTKIFNYVNPPATVANNANYLGNGYWKRPDKSENKLEAVQSFQIGSGAKATKINAEEGQWWGGDKFEDSRASMDPNGNFVFRDQNKIPTILIGETTIK